VKYFRRLRARHWAWLNFLAIVGIAWPTFMLVAPPAQITEVIDPVIYSVIMGLSLAGTILAMFGYFASQQVGSLGVIGISLELAGLILAFIGPAALFVTRVFLLFEPHLEPLSTVLFYDWAVCAIFLYRFVIVIPRFRFEAHDPAKE